MTLTTSRAKAQRAREYRAYVRVLLWKRHPAFAAALADALAAAERDLPCPACPCRQQEMIAHRQSKAPAIGSKPGQRRGTARMPGTGAVSRPWEVSDERQAMRDPEGYCFWCGKWQGLPFFRAICRQCHESRPASQRETR